MDPNPLYDEECISEEDKILIQLEVMMINNFLARIVAVEATQIDFNAKLNYIASWLEKPKDCENNDCVFERECIMFVDAVERDTLTLLTYKPMLQNSFARDIVDCRRAWMTITNFAEFVELEGKSRTTEAQSNTRMHYTSMFEDFKLSNWKSMKRR